MAYSLRSQPSLRRTQRIQSPGNEHGIKDYEISDASVDNFQQEVDDLIYAGATDLATLVAPQPEVEEQA
ncbi:hypothetical protein B0H13DRAFT_2314372 [Mycena leptocephala]|nr:hypothetical protein B0H13DRAFT_2314372 [Mycena leptocephala]